MVILIRKKCVNYRNKWRIWYYLYGYSEKSAILNMKQHVAILVLYLSVNNCRSRLRSWIYKKLLITKMTVSATALNHLSHQRALTYCVSLCLNYIREKFSLRRFIDCWSRIILYLTQKHHRQSRGRICYIDSSFHQESY